MVEHFKLSFAILFGVFAENIFYEFDIVYTKESVEKNGYLDGNNFVLIQGIITDPENLLKKYYCDESKWKKDMVNYLTKNNLEELIKMFENK